MSITSTVYARTRILGRIRTSLKVKADEPARHAAAAERIATHPANLIPARATAAGVDRLALFRSYLDGQQAKLVEVNAATDVPAAVLGLLDAAGGGRSIRRGADPRLAAMPWSSAKGLDVSEGAAMPDDKAGLSYALAGIAETGTLILAAGRDNPVTLAFMPDTHIIVVEKGAIVATYEDALALVRESFGDKGMPRTLNYISGPSRTADIGGKIVIGAHGPRTLGVIIVE